jgi:hypothetical protein
MASPISHFQSYSTGRPLVSMQYSYNRATLQMHEKCGRKLTTVSITADELHALENMHFNDFIEPARIFAAAENA